MYRINLAVEQLDQWKALTRPLSFLTFKSLLHFFILYVFYFWMLSLVFGFFNRFFITILHLAFISFYLSFHNSRDYLFCYVGDTASKVSKYRVFSGPYFPTFGMNTDQKKSPYFDTFYAVRVFCSLQKQWSTRINKPTTCRCFHEEVFHQIDVHPISKKLWRIHENSKILEKYLWINSFLIKMPVRQHATLLSEGKKN